ncbi:MAG: hypothetical protein ACLTEE_16200 [Anaerobutyricum hallii]
MAAHREESAIRIIVIREFEDRRICTGADGVLLCIGGGGFGDASGEAKNA